MTSASSLSLMLTETEIRPAGQTTFAATTQSADRGEEYLLNRAQRGDVEAFYELIRPLERAVYLSAFSLLRNEADAEEVAQETVLKAFRSISRFRGEAKFSTWLIQIAINEGKMRLRKDRRYLYESIEQGQVSDDGDYVPREFPDWREIPSETLERKELRDALAAALHALPEKYRTVVMLRDIQHLSIVETAQVLGISEANVKTRLSRARLQMRDALALWNSTSENTCSGGAGPLSGHMHRASKRNATL